MAPDVVLESKCVENQLNKMATRIRIAKLCRYTLAAFLVIIFYVCTLNNIESPIRYTFVNTSNGDTSSQESHRSQQSIQHSLMQPLVSVSKRRQNRTKQMESRRTEEDIPLDIYRNLGLTKTSKTVKASSWNCSGASCDEKYKQGPKCSALMDGDDDEISLAEARHVVRPCERITETLTL